jgi:hypothetical protein
MRWILAALAFLVLPAMTLAGQKPAHPTLDSALSRLPIEGSIRVATLGTRSQGLLREITADSIRIGYGPAERTFAIARIDTLWTDRRGTARGARIGAITGMASGGVLGFLAVLMLCDSRSTCIDDADNFLGLGLGAAVGAAGGALVGALIGSAGREWRRIHP